MTDALFHLADPVDWDVDAPEYRAPSLATEGFIHCSTGEQLAATHARYYADRTDMVLLEIDPEAIDGSILRWEPASGGDLFAHIYGPVPARAVRAAAPYPPSVDQGRQRSPSSTANVSQRLTSPSSNPTRNHRLR